MRLSRHGARPQIEINMTPMIDVVFQLLIFFMTCSQVSEVNREPVQLPKLVGGQSAADSEMIVNIDREGTILASGKKFTIDRVLQACEDDAAKLKHDISMTIVVLRIDRNAPCKTVNELMTALARRGIPRVRLAIAADS